MSKRLISKLVLATGLSLAAPAFLSADEPAPLAPSVTALPAVPAASASAAATQSPSDKDQKIMGDCCSGDCLKDSCCAERDWVWLAGTEAVFLSCNAHNSGTSVEATSLAGTTSGGGSGSFDGVTYAPRVWIGVQGDCWGLVGRFFYLSDFTDSSGPFLGNSSLINDRLKLYTTDLEVTRRGMYNCTKLDASFGVRYASLDASGANAAISTDILTTGIATAYSASSFNGTGITGALQGRTPVSCCSNLHYFWNVRGSVLWGSSSASAITTAAALTPLAGGASANAAFASNDESTLWIGEAQVGLQWEHQLKCIPANAFFRIAAEYQHWSSDTGNGAFATSFALTPGAGAVASAQAGDIELDLVGMTIGTGFTW